MPRIRHHHRDLTRHPRPVGEHVESPWIVILYNDDWHPSTRWCSRSRRRPGAPWRSGLDHAEAHTMGRAVAYTGTLERCERVAGI